MKKLVTIFTISAAIMGGVISSAFAWDYIQNEDDFDDISQYILIEYSSITDRTFPNFPIEHEIVVGFRCASDDTPMFFFLRQLNKLRFFDDIKHIQIKFDSEKAKDIKPGLPTLLKNHVIIYDKKDINYLIEKMKSHNKMKIRYRAAGNGRETVEFNLKGFSSEYSKFEPFCN